MAITTQAKQFEWLELAICGLRCSAKAPEVICVRILCDPKWLCCYLFGQRRSIDVYHAALTWVLNMFTEAKTKHLRGVRVEVRPVSQCSA